MHETRCEQGEQSKKGTKVINEKKITLADEVAIVSLNESDAFVFFCASVTYVQQSIYDLGRQVVKIATRVLQIYSRQHQVNAIEFVKYVIKNFPVWIKTIRNESGTSSKPYFFGELGSPSGTPLLHKTNTTTERKVDWIIRIFSTPMKKAAL